MPAQQEFPARIQSVERLLAEIESTADPSLRTNVRLLVQLVMELHGAGLERMLEMIRGAGEGGEGLVQKLGRDDLVASLLLLHGLHPVDLEARVASALEKARTRLRAHDGEVELLGMEDGAVRLRLRANGHGCHSSADALREIVENAVYQAAPDITALVIEGATEKGFIPLEVLLANTSVPPVSGSLVAVANTKGGL